MAHTSDAKLENEKKEEIDEKNVALEKSLIVKGPFTLKHAPNAYSFDRLRTININWEDLLSESGIKIESDEADSIKNAFERNWKDNIGHDIKDYVEKHTHDLSNEWPAYVHNPNSIQNTKEPIKSGFYIFRTNFNDPKKDKDVEKIRKINYKTAPRATDHLILDEGCVLEFKTNNKSRWFQPVTLISSETEPKYPLKDVFSNDWDKAWKTVSYLVELRFPGAKPDGELSAETKEQLNAQLEAKEFFTAYETVRADAALIVRQYNYLKNEKMIADALMENSKKILTELESAPFESIELISNAYRKMVEKSIDVELKLKQLVDAASDIGYVLVTEPEKVSYFDEKGGRITGTLQPGTLYLKERKTVNWITYQTVVKKRRRLFSSRTIRYKVPIHNTKTFDYYEEAHVDFDPWVEAAEVYGSRDDSGYDVFLFRHTPQGLISSDGTTPSDVLNRCEIDEEFRRRCIVAFPEYEYTIIGEKFLIGYSFVFRPLPEITVTAFPTIDIIENLSYRFVWTGVALGELAATIPLSPGEEREVKISHSQTTKTSRDQATSSLVDVNTSAKRDFETYFEKEVRKENESSTNASAEIGGSYGGVVSGSASMSKTTKTKDLSRKLNRSVQKAANEVNRRSREETKITVQESDETTSSTTTSFKVQNINQSKTLNIAFYNLMNVYKSALRLDDFDLHVYSGRELVMGQAVYDGKKHPRSDIKGIVDWMLDNKQLPIDYESVTDKAREKLGLKFHEIVLGDLRKEYLSKEQAKINYETLNRKFEEFESTGNESAEQYLRGIASKHVLNIGDIPREFVGHVEGDNKEAGILQILSESESALLKHVIGKDFDESSFSYASDGLYSDVYLGKKEGVEEYSQDMRELEKAAKAAQNLKERARATYLLSKAFKQGAIEPYCTAVSVLYETGGHVLVKLQIYPTALSVGGWILKFKSYDEYPINISTENGAVEYKLPRRYSEKEIAIGEWSEEKFESEVTLIEKTMDMIIPYRRLIASVSRAP